MAIQNKIQFRGMIASAGYSRFVRGSLEITPTGPKIIAQFQDFATAEASLKVLEDVKRPVAQDYDPENEEHVKQWRANGGLDADGKEVAYDPALNLNSLGQPWRPFVYVTEQKWLGKTAEPPLQDRTVDLPLEQALQLLQRAVPGAADDLSDNLVAEFYRAAMATGAFEDAIAV